MTRSASLIALGALAGLSGCAPAHVERRFSVMGTYATAEVYAAPPRAAERAIAEIVSAFEQVDATMSNWKGESELSLVNRDAARGPRRVVDPDLFRCIEIALQYARFSDGAFDPTVGPLMRLWGFRPFAPRV